MSTVDRAGPLAIGKEPDVRGSDAPIRAPVVEQPLGERDVAVLGAFPLADVDSHAVGIEVGDLEGDGFADAETTGVGGGEQEAMARMWAGAQETPHLFATEDVGELLGLLVGGDLERGLLPPEGHVVEKPERMGGLGAGAPRALALPEHQRDVRLHLVGGELIGRPVVLAGQAHALLDVTPRGFGGRSLAPSCRESSDHAAHS
jgi:hypothetical protein